jgi:hypothetical protein
VNVDAIASVNRLARRQHGAFSVRQVLRAGVSRQQMRTRLATGDWERAAVGVLVLSGTPDTWIRRAMVATLVREGRLWVSHSAAAFLHGFDGFDLEPRLELITRRGHHPRLPFGARLRSTDLLGRKCFTTARHVPVSNAATTLCLIAESVRAERVAQALDHVLRVGWSPRWVRGTAEQLRDAHVRGAAVVLDLLHQRLGSRLPQSWFERVARRVLADAGVALVHEYPIRDASGRILASLDLAEPRSRVGVECQSWAEHSTPTAMYSDARRKRLVRRMGWDIVEVWWSDLARPDEMAAEVSDAIRRQQRR